MEIMHVNELAKIIGCSTGRLRAMLCRADFASIRNRKGMLEGITPEHIALIRFMKKNRDARKGFYGEVDY